jgi:hypothetical protein
MKRERLLSYDWDAIAGVLAAVVAIVLHLLHVVSAAVVLPILLALLGLLFINFMRHTRSNDVTAERVERVEQSVARLAAGMEPPDVVLVGPRRLRSVHERFLRDMQGDSVWYNVCLSMYATPDLFDRLLRPAVENPNVVSLQFVLDERQREAWERQVRPLLERCAGSAKVREPRWRPLERTVSFILADSRSSGRAEALLSFWGEPFMAQSADRDVPRYVLHVQPQSELLAHLGELQRMG